MTFAELLLMGRAISSLLHCVQEEWPFEFLQSQVDFTDCQIDASPFQLVERTSLHKVPCLLIH